MKPELKIKKGEVYIDPSGKHQKYERILFWSYFYEEFCILFHTGKAEYESTILKDWTRTGLKYIPGEQIKLF